MSSSRFGTSLTKYFRRFELDSIRNQILLFAVLATLVPSGITAWISYSQNRRALETRINRELITSSQQSAREIEVWLKERLQELRTFAISGEVAQTLAPGRIGQPSSRARLSEYLRSVRGRLLEYAELVVLDTEGRPIATTARELKPIRLPSDWSRIFRQRNQLVGEAYWDSLSRGGQLVLAVPVTRSGLDGTLLGAFAARVQLSGLQQELAEFATGTEMRLYLATVEGATVVSSIGSAAEVMSLNFKPGAMDRLTKSAGTTVVYPNPSEEEAVGAWAPVTVVPWGVIASIPGGVAFREVREFRNLAMMLVAGLLIVVSLIAYRFGLVIVRPLDRLTRGASEVAAGDLAVDLPAGGGKEVGYLTHVFNNMVAHLRENRKELDSRNATLKKKNEELELLSTTDALTGLSNRRELGRRLGEEVQRHKRNKQPLTVLMADVDHFKAYNDTHGHPAGDEVLKRVAKLLRESTRDVDCVARYGGEEFCVLLPETSSEAAMQVAERIRSRIASEKFPGRHITVSLGVAELPKNGETPEAVVGAADAALYQAKRAGRDRVVRAK